MAGKSKVVMCPHCRKRMCRDWTRAEGYHYVCRHLCTTKCLTHIKLIEEA